MNSKSPQLEKQFVLRVPLEIADKIREQQVQCELEFKAGGIVNLSIGGHNLKGQIHSLPCVLETQKSLDGSNFFKSGDIGQIIVVSAEEPTLNPLTTLTSGLTPPTKDIQRRRWRTPPDSSLLAEREREVLRAIRGGADQLEIEEVDPIEFATAEDSIVTLAPPVPLAWRFVDPEKARDAYLRSQQEPSCSASPESSSSSASPAPSFGLVDSSQPSGDEQLLVSEPNYQPFVQISEEESLLLEPEPTLKPIEFDEILQPDQKGLVEDEDEFPILQFSALSITPPVNLASTNDEEPILTPVNPHFEPPIDYDSSSDLPLLMPFAKPLPHLNPVERIAPPKAVQTNIFSYLSRRKVPTPIDRPALLTAKKTLASFTDYELSKTWPLNDILSARRLELAACTRPPERLKLQQEIQKLETDMLKKMLDT